MNKIETTFVLGYYRFRLQSHCPVLINSLTAMLPTINWQTAGLDLGRFQSQQPEVIDLDIPIRTDTGMELRLSSLSPAHSVAYLLDCSLKFHHGLIWLEAAALVDANNSLVLICGASQSGKTTLSLALSTIFAWKIVSEDILLIDGQCGRLIPFARPLGLRDDSLDRIIDASSSTELHGNSADEWYFDPNIYYYKDVSPQFSRAILLNSANPQPALPLSVEAVSPEEYLRKILPIANCVRLEGATELVHDCLRHADCFIVTGGKLQERLQFLQSQSIKNSLGVS